MGYRQSRFDPLYPDPDMPPRTLNTSRKRMLEASLVISALGVFGAFFEGLISMRWAALAMLWGSAIFAILFGAFPTYRIFREDDPQFFQSYLKVSLVAAVIITSLIFWLGPKG